MPSEVVTRREDLEGNWAHHIYRWFYNLLCPEPALKAASGFNNNLECNPLEYDCLGRQIDCGHEDLGIITEIEEATMNLMRPEMNRRLNLNKRRDKFNLQRMTAIFSKHDMTSEDVSTLMHAFDILDENDDLLIDHLEFVRAIWKNNRANDLETDEELEAKVFNTAVNEEVLDLEDFLKLCAWAQGKITCPGQHFDVIEKSSFKSFIDDHINQSKQAAESAMSLHQHFDKQEKVRTSIKLS